MDGVGREHDGGIDLAILQGFFGRFVEQNHFENRLACFARNIPRPEITFVEQGGVIQSPVCFGLIEAPRDKRFQMEFRLRQILGPLDSDDGFLIHQRESKAEADQNECRVEKGGKKKDDHQRPTISQQIANLSAGDERDDACHRRYRVSLRNSRSN